MRIFWLFLLLPISVFAQSFDVQLRVVEQTADGGFLLGGTTNLKGSAQSDAWVLKINASGATVWQGRYGGKDLENIESARQTPDGGYVLAGSIRRGQSPADGWVLRLSASGAIVWQRTFGGPQQDSFYAVEVLNDNTFLLAGDTDSFGAGQRDGWLLRLNSSGQIIWQRTAGTSEFDSFRSTALSRSGEVLVAGISRTGNNDDAVVLQLDANASVVRQKLYGAVSSNELPVVVRATADGGLILGGAVRAIGSQNSDGWLLRLNSSGDVMWRRRSGNQGIDSFHDVRQLADGTFAAAGLHRNSAGVSVVSLLRLNAGGGRLWHNTYGSLTADSAAKVIASPGDALILIGEASQGGSEELSFYNITRTGQLPCSGLQKKASLSLNNATVSSTVSRLEIRNSSAVQLKRAISRKGYSTRIRNLCPDSGNQNPVLLKSGTFVRNPNTDYQVDGSAFVERLSDNSIRVRLSDDFSSSNGPRLEVYLSRTSGITSQSRPLGRLQSTSGAQIYSVPVDLNIDSHNYVIIHCVSFNVSFGSANLQ